jgi:hypothetical protein
MTLIHPNSHQLNFRPLIRDDLLRRPAHLGIVALQRLDLATSIAA